MRLFLLTLLIASLFGSSGCMVLDEIDKASAKMDGGATAAQESDASSAAPAPTKKSALLEESKKWWNKAKSLSTEKVGSDIVECVLPRGIQFTAKDNCLSRGGVPRRV